MTGGRERKEARQQAAAGSARSLRAARQSLGGLAVEVGARGPEPRALGARSLQVDRHAARRAPSRPPALHRGRDRQSRARAGSRRRVRGDHRPAEAHLQHLEQDAAEAVGHRQPLRHSRGADPGRRRQGVLSGARRRPSPLDAAAARVRRLHREAEGQRLSIAAHRR
jgi:hypothetical protein